MALSWVPNPISPNEDSYHGDKGRRVHRCGIEWDVNVNVNFKFD
jgi:hypothetical protein